MSARQPWCVLPSKINPLEKNLNQASFKYQALIWETLTQCSQSVIGWCVLSDKLSPSNLLGKRKSKWKVV